MFSITKCRRDKNGYYIAKTRGGKDAKIIYTFNNGRFLYICDENVYSVNSEGRLLASSTTEVDLITPEAYSGKPEIVYGS